MITLENPVSLNQPLATPSTRAAATIQPLVSENREHLGDSLSFSSDFQALSPCGHLPRVFLPSALLYLPLAMHPFAFALIPRFRDVQHRDGTVVVAASS